MAIDLPPLGERGIIIANTENLATTSITLSFESCVSWTLETLTADIIAWLNADHDSTTSKVGILSSPNFAFLVRPAVGPQACLSFQRMLYAQSLAYTQTLASYPDCLSVTELQQVAALAGHSFLLGLDKRFTPDQLGKCSGGELRALFLVTFGTILAVGYASPEADSPEFPLYNVRNLPSSHRVLLTPYIGRAKRE
jgi:hypothetical protein